MAKRIKSGLKRLRQSVRREERNKGPQSRIKTLSKTAVGGPQDSLLPAIKAIDKAAAKGIIHKNVAARKKSRLIHRHRAATRSA